MSRLVEANGAQVLPNIQDPQSTASGWAAHLAADGDMRAKHPEYASLAASLFVEVDR